MFLDLLAVTEAKDAERAAKIREKYSHEVERYREEQKEIETEAKKLENETKRQRRRADRLDLGEGFLEVALVITSITLLTRRRIFWHLGMLFGLLGVVVAATGLFAH